MFFNEDGAEVADERSLDVVVGRVAAAEDERLSVEHPAVGVVAQVVHHHVGAAFIMDVAQTIVGDGYELRLVVGRSRRLGVPFHQSRPQHVLLAVAHAVDVAFEFLVGVDGNVLGEIVVVVDAVEHVVAPVFRFPSFLNEVFQHRVLQFVG